jgi:hypothetical protein
LPVQLGAAGTLLHGKLLIKLRKRWNTLEHFAQKMEPDGTFGRGLAATALLFGKWKLHAAHRA